MFVVCISAASLCAAETDESQTLLERVTESGVRCKIVLHPKPHFIFSGGDGFSDISEEALSNWRVVVDREGVPGTQPSVLGSFVAQAEGVRFDPRFSLQPGVRYKVEIPGPPSESVVLEIPSRNASSAPSEVAAIYPSGDVLPENVLKFYIHFSKPMRRGRAYEWIELLEDGKPLDSPFLELGEELWDREQRRFTLLVHPGRIKRGVKPNMDSGPAMKAGARYTLRISSKWLTAAGQPLDQAYEKSFRVARPDREQPHPSNWKIQIPKSRTKEPVSLEFDEPLDHALLHHMLRVLALDGTPVAGDVKVGSTHDQWRLVPDAAWEPGRYQIVVNSALEDLCGNSIARPFEVQLQAGAAAQENRDQEIAIEFDVGG
ncbi:MAG: hypothetical protein Aurels2KO_17130 [Aureliella sp.]